MGDGYLEKSTFAKRNQCYIGLEKKHSEVSEKGLVSLIYYIIFIKDRILSFCDRGKQKVMPEEQKCPQDVLICFFWSFSQNLI